MRKATRRIYFSILILLTSLIAMGATTFAWVGMIGNSLFEEFNINLMQVDSDDAEYGIQLSLDGTHFSDAIDPVLLKRQLLKNLGYNKNLVDSYNDDNVNLEFHRINLSQTTTFRYENNENVLKEFFTIRGGQVNNSAKYFWFDLYLRLYKKDGSVDDGDNYLDVYLKQIDGDNGKLGIIDSDSYSTRVINKIYYPSSNPIDNKILGVTGTGSNGLPLGINSLPLNTLIYGDVKVKTANSCRLAFEKYQTKAVGDTSWDYGSVKGLTIFRTGSQLPMYNQDTNEYDFGGVLPKDYNFAYLYHKSLNNDDLEYLDNEVDFQKVLNRGDVLYDERSETSHLITEDDKVTTGNMARFRIKFWFEGWDANCFDVIDRKNVSINLAFSSKGYN